MEAGRRTLSTTWITPLSHAMSPEVIFASPVQILTEGGVLDSVNIVNIPSFNIAPFKVLTVPSIDSTELAGTTPLTTAHKKKDEEGN